MLKKATLGYELTNKVPEDYKKNWNFFVFGDGSAITEEKMKKFWAYKDKLINNNEYRKECD